MSEGDFVYVIRYAPDRHKIGMSADPEARLRTLQAQDHRRLRLVEMWHRERADAREIEGLAHRILSAYSIDDDATSEMFRVGEAAACLAVDLAVSLTDGEGGEFTPASRTLSRAVVIAMARIGKHMGGSGSHRHIGCLLSRGEDAVRQGKAMRKAGVFPDRVYTTLVPALKDVRQGDTLVVSPEGDTSETRDVLVARGVHLLVVR